MTNHQYAPIPVAPFRVNASAGVFPTKLSGNEGFLRGRIRDLFAPLRILKLREFGKLGPPAIAHSIGQFRLKITKEWEGLRCTPFLAHEYHRNLRREKIDGRDRADSLTRRKCGDALAERAISHLIVILNERDEGGRG